MANINRVVLVGNLTRDPELRHTPARHGRLQAAARGEHAPQGRAPASGRDKPNYFDVTVWGNQGENCAQYLAKGRPVGVDGRLEWREWEAQDGSKRAGGRDRRRHRPVPRQPQRGRRRGAAQYVPAGATRPPTTSLGRRRRRRHPVLGRSDGTETDRSTRKRPAPAGAARAAQELLLLQGQGRRDRLQEHQPAPPLHLREGQDPQPPHHAARAGATSARSRSRSSAHARWRSCPTSRARSDGSHPAQRRREARPARRGRRTSRAATRATSCCRASSPSPRRPAGSPSSSSATSSARGTRRGRASRRRRSPTCSRKTVLRFEVKAGPTGSLFGSVTPTDIADELWRTRKIRVDRRKIGIDTIKRIGRYRCRSRSSRTSRSRSRRWSCPRAASCRPRRSSRRWRPREAAEADAQAEAARGARPQPPTRRPRRPSSPRRPTSEAAASTRGEPEARDEARPSRSGAEAAGRGRRPSAPTGAAAPSSVHRASSRPSHTALHRRCREPCRTNFPLGAHVFAADNCASSVAADKSVRRWG